MSQDVARSGSRPVPVALGCSSLLYRFWSIQIDSLTEFCAGSRVSTFTAFAMTRVLSVAVVPLPGPPEPLVVAERPHPAAASASTTSPALSVRSRMARTIAHLIPFGRLSTTVVPNCKNGGHGRQYSPSRGVNDALSQGA